MSNLEQMSDLDQLLLTAFDTALEQLDSPLPDPLQAKLNHLRNQPDVSVKEFDALAESYAPLKERYEQACLELVRHGGQRKQFLVPSGHAPTGLPKVDQLPLADSDHVDHGKTTLTAAITMTLAALGHAAAKKYDEIDASSPAQADSPANSEPDTTPPAIPSKPPHSIYRFFLPAGATAGERRQFQQNVEWIKQANPSWVVSPDRPLPGEADAIVLIYNDENYLPYHAGYLATRILSDMTYRAYGC